MKTIFLDTNFVIDLLLRPEYKDVSKRFLELSVRSGHKLTISTLTLANFAYITRKLPVDQLYGYLKSISTLFEMVSLTHETVAKAIELRLKDFEDALQYQCALACGASFIITRNEKVFYGLKIPAVSAENFLREKRNIRDL